MAVSDERSMNRSTAYCSEAYCVSKQRHGEKDRRALTLVCRLDVFGHRSPPRPLAGCIPENVCLSSPRPLPPHPPASRQIGRLYSHHPQSPLSPFRLAQYVVPLTVSVFHNPILISFSFPVPVHLFWPVVKIRWRAWCARIRTLSLSSAVRDAAARKFLDDLCPVGQNPLDFTLVTKAWAGVYLCSLVQQNFAY